MTKHSLIPLLFGALLSAPAAFSQCVSLTTSGVASTQNFNGLATTGTSSTLPAGWFLSESGTSANATYTAGTGSLNTGDTYSFGAAASTERAFGGVQSGALIPTVGACFTNNTGTTISALQIGYTGEQWRLGAVSTGRTDHIDFAYSTDATSLATGTWTAVTALNFTGPVTGGTVGPLDGNAAANRTALSSTISSLSFANGSTFFIRWTDFNANGADDGLAVDDFSLTPNPGGIQLTVNDVGAAEGDSGTTNFTFTVSLSAPAEAGGVTFNIATADGTATAPSDYAAQTLTSQIIPENSSTYTFTVAVNGDTASEAGETFFVNVTNVTGATVADGQGVGTIQNDEAATCSPTATIAGIQGPGGTSPVNGSTQTTTGIVTLLRSNGFFLQMPSPGDSDPAASDGVFVFTSSAPAVAVGDVACVTATVTEFTGASSTDPQNTLTELGSPTVTKTGTAALPAPVTLAPDANGAKDQFERLEGMRVQAASLTVVAPTDGTVTETAATSASNGAFWTVVTGTNRPLREPGVDVTHPIAASLPPCCIPLFDSNPERIQVFSGAPGVTKIDVASGAILTGVTGVMDVFSGDYELTIEPATVPLVSNNGLTFTAVPVPSASELTVATANLERFYDTVNDPSTSDVILTPTAFANRKKKASLAIRNVLNSPDIVAVEEMENLSTLQSLATQISDDAIAAGQTDPQYAAYLVDGNDIGGIDVGFLVKPSRVTVNSVTQFGAATTFTNPSTNQQDILNDRPPLLLTGTAHNGSAIGLPLTVIVNHLKALPADDPADARVRVKREAQAEYLANLIQARQTANPNELIVSVGDYNAFEFNDGMADVIGVVRGVPSPANQVLVAGPTIVTPAMTELASSFLSASQRYSYSFGGNAQALDHMLVNQKLLARVTQFAIGRTNADFPEIFRSDANRPERISDHDPEIAYIRLPAATDATASVTFAASGLVLNRATQLYNGTVTVKNTSGSTINGPVQVAFQALPADVTLTNASGYIGSVPYVTSPGSLAPGASVTIPVQFRVLNGARVSYTLNLYTGTL